MLTVWTIILYMASSGRFPVIIFLLCIIFKANIFTSTKFLSHEKNIKPVLYVNLVGHSTN